MLPPANHLTVGVLKGIGAGTTVGSVANANLAGCSRDVDHGTIACVSHVLTYLGRSGMGPDVSSHAGVALSGMDRCVSQNP